MLVTVTVRTAVPPANVKPVALAVRLRPLKLAAEAAPVTAKVPEVLKLPALMAFVTFNVFVKVAELKVGLELVLISCGVLKVIVRVPLLLLITIWLVVPCNWTAPLMAFSESTAPPAPPPPVVQAEQVRLPLASIAKGPDALTATVPLALGTVMVLLDPAGVAKFTVLVNPAEVLEIDTAAPWTVTF